MLFRDTTWKGARIDEGSRWRNSIALYRIPGSPNYHKTTKWFGFTGRMLCGARYQGAPSDYVRVSRNDLDAWPVCETCAHHKGF